MTGSTVTLPPPELPVGPRSALVLATTTYADETLGAMRAPATDAEELAAVLADPAVGGFTVTSVVDRTVHEMRIAIADFLGGRVPEELVVVYLSCHGVTDLWRRLYFAATDTLKTKLAATGIEAEYVLERLDECRARSQVVILDCCFSGAFITGAKGTGDIGLDSLAAPGRGRAVLTASNEREYSFTNGMAGPASQERPAPASVFTAALLAGLRDGAADKDGDGFITVDEAYAFALQRVRELGAAQTPQRWLTGEGSLLLARNPSGRLVRPAEIPAALRSALDSPIPDVRVGGVQVLSTWLRTGTPSQQLAGRLELQAVAASDIPRVASAARLGLSSLETLVLGPLPESPPEPGEPGPEPEEPGPEPWEPGPEPEEAEPEEAEHEEAEPEPEKHSPPVSAPQPPSHRKWWIVPVAVAGVLTQVLTAWAVGRWLAGLLPQSASLPDAQLVVAVSEGTNTDLYLADAGRPGPVRRLTSGPGTETAANLSPDRATVVFRSWQTDGGAGSVLEVMAVDGSNRRELLDPERNPCGTGIYRPAWNPADATQLAITCRSQDAIHLINTDGRVLRTIDVPVGSVGDLTFSRDGTRLAFWGAQRASGRDGGAIWHLDLETSQIRRLTNAADGLDTGPAWAPDGQSIVFTRRDADRPASDLGLYSVRIADRHVETLLDRPDASEADASFAPDGSQLAYVSDRGTKATTGAGQVWVLTLADKRTRLLWPGTAENRLKQTSPIWSTR